MVSLMRGGLLTLITLLSACTSTGNSFDLNAIQALQIGQTTKQQAVTLLQAEPVNYYHQSNGAYLALWRFTKTVLTDAVYIERELLLEFDSHHTLVAIKKQPSVYHPEPTPVEPRLGR